MLHVLEMVTGLTNLKISKCGMKGVFFAFNKSRRTSYSLPRLSADQPWQLLWAFQKKWWGGKAVSGEWIPLRKNIGRLGVLWVRRHNFCISYSIFLAWGLFLYEGNRRTWHRKVIVSRGCLRAVLYCPHNLRCFAVSNIPSIFLRLGCFPQSWPLFIS